MCSSIELIVTVTGNTNKNNTTRGRIIGFLSRSRISDFFFQQWHACPKDVVDYIFYFCSDTFSRPFLLC